MLTTLTAAAVLAPRYHLHNISCISGELGLVTEGGHKVRETRMWANAQRDGRPAEHRWRPLFNAAKFG